MSFFPNISGLGKPKLNTKSRNYWKEKMNSFDFIHTQSFCLTKTPWTQSKVKQQTREKHLFTRHPKGLTDFVHKVYLKINKKITFPTCIHMKPKHGETVQRQENTMAQPTSGRCLTPSKQGKCESITITKYSFSHIQPGDHVVNSLPRKEAGKEEYLTLMQCNWVVRSLWRALWQHPAK